MSARDKINQKCQEINEMLCQKNDAYGNSVLDPVRVFSKADAVEQINVRLDDKLSRLTRGEEYPGDDTLLDIAGYVILLLVARDEVAYSPPAPPRPRDFFDKDGDRWTHHADAEWKPTDEITFRQLGVRHYDWIKETYGPLAWVEE